MFAQKNAINNLFFSILNSFVYIHLKLSLFVWTGEFLYGRSISSEEGTQRDTGPCQNPPETLYQSQWEERLAGVEDEEEKHFCMLMESLGASTVFEE